MKYIRLRLKPLKDIIKSSASPGLWAVTGSDPQFLLTRRFGRRIEGGLYWIIASPGHHMTDLDGAVIYIDTGSGFSEERKKPIRFEVYEDGQIKAFLRLSEPAKRLRFDPCEAGRPSFGLRNLTLALRDSVPGANSSVKPQPVWANAQPRVLLNLVRLLPESNGAGGAGRLATALLTHLPQSVNLRVAISSAWERLIMRFPQVDFIVVPSDENAHLAEALAWCQCYIDPMNGLRPMTIDPRVAVISMVLDLQHMRMPWLFSEAEIRHRILEYGYAIARSDRLVAISSYEADNLVEFYGVDRISTAHLAGFMAEDSGLEPDAVRQRCVTTSQVGSYLIYPAVPWLHKNHEILVQAIGILKRRGVDIPLILTNTAGKTGSQERLTEVAKSLRIDDLVTLKAFISEQELLDLFIQSRGMLFPSLYEGFGIPLVDAMALGVPVLTNDTSAVHEICGDAAAYFANATNAIVIADDIEAFWNDDDGRRSLAAAGIERAKQFSSAKMVAGLRQAIDVAIRAKQAPRPLLPLPSRFVPPRYLHLSVFVCYADLDEADRRILLEIPDIVQFHASIFGPMADITVGLDVALVDDPTLRNFFKKAPKLICFDACETVNLDRAVRDFSMRFDHSEFHLITAYKSDAFKNYSPDALTAALMSLRLHDTADYVVFDESLCDSVADGCPEERAGILDYERRRRLGLSVTDTIIRRASARDQKNGTVAFLSQFCSTYQRLRIPAVRH